MASQKQAAEEGNGGGSPLEQTLGLALGLRSVVSGSSVCDTWLAKPMLWVDVLAGLEKT